MSVNSILLLGISCQSVIQLGYSETFFVCCFLERISPVGLQVGVADEVATNTDKQVIFLLSPKRVTEAAPCCACWCSCSKTWCGSSCLRSACWCWRWWERGGYNGRRTAPPGWRRGTVSKHSGEINEHQLHFTHAFMHWQPFEAAYLFVGEEVDDGVIDWTGLGKVHGHRGKQRRNIKLWIHHHHHWQRRVGQPTHKKSYDHGQDHADGMIILLLAGAPALEFHTPVQLRAQSRFTTVYKLLTCLAQSVGGKLPKDGSGAMDFKVQWICRNHGVPTFFMDVSTLE